MFYFSGQYPADELLFVFVFCLKMVGARLERSGNGARNACMSASFFLVTCCPLMICERYIRVSVQGFNLFRNAMQMSKNERKKERKEYLKMKMMKKNPENCVQPGGGRAGGRTDGAVAMAGRAAGGNNARDVLQKKNTTRKR